MTTTNPGTLVKLAETYFTLAKPDEICAVRTSLPVMVTSSVEPTLWSSTEDRASGIFHYPSHAIAAPRVGIVATLLIFLGQRECWQMRPPQPVSILRPCRCPRA